MTVFLEDGPGGARGVLRDSGCSYRGLWSPKKMFHSCAVTWKKSLVSGHVGAVRPKGIGMAHEKAKGLYNGRNLQPQASKDRPRNLTLLQA